MILSAKRRGDQITRYVYGTTLADSSIARSDLLRAEIYPDSDDTTNPLGNGPDGVYDRVEYTHNRQGERTTKKDQNETVHAFDYDLLGRLIEDRVTAVGSGVDDQVRRIATRYTVRGQVETITSYDDPAVGTGTVLNEVRYVYNAFDQLTADYQNHSGAVDMVTTPKVAYTYTDGSLGHARPTQLVYPNGRVLRYEYTAGTDDALNRVSFLADDASGAISTHLAEYSYLGTGHFVCVDYTEPSLRHDLAHGTGDDPYAGLDRFDRIVDLVWRDQARDVNAERVKHGYDRVGNRLWRETSVATASGANLDELYGYDGVNRLTAFARGDLNAAKNGLVTGTKTLAQEWSLDATGNWSGFKEDADGNGTWNLDQSRSHNPVNEITHLAGTNLHVVHDGAGNMTRLPKLVDWNAHHDPVYDAWNRLVQVVDGETTVADYAYDGRNFRTTETFARITRHYYYSKDWRVLEEHVGSVLSADRQFVWGLRYIDDLVLRDRDANGGALDERFYALQDANWNVVVILNVTGAIQERYTYTAYGVPQFLTGSFGGRASSAYTWETLYCGYRWDKLVGAYHVRHRLLFSHLGRWNRPDPIGYEAASCASLYEYVFDSPVTRTDASGLQAFPIFPPGGLPPEWNPGKRKPWPVDPPNPPIVPGGDPNNNCYNHACGMYPPYPPFWQVGDLIGAPPGAPLNCAELIDLVMREQNAVKPGFWFNTCPNGYHKIRVWLNPGVDYHFYRQEPDSKWYPDQGWSDKPGRCHVRPNLPRPGEYEPGYKNCGDLCVPN